MTEFDSSYLQDLQQRIRVGDKHARDDLIRACHARVERLASKMLRGFPAVKRWDDTMDVLNTSLMKLLRSLETVEVATTRDFFNFAAVHIRRHLIDRARQILGKEGIGTNHQSWVNDPNASGRQMHEPVDPRSVADLESWMHLHESIDDLPTEEREVFSLRFYHGWKEGQIAELFGVCERTVRRRYYKAIDLLRDRIRDLPLD